MRQCDLLQVLCLIGETIVVRDLDQKLIGIPKEPPHKTEAIEFKVDYMQDDSYLQVNSDIPKEESQKRMYGALGVPCIESALDGYNTTVFFMPLLVHPLPPINMHASLTSRAMRT